jgi:hypothetical protein
MVDLNKYSSSESGTHYLNSKPIADKELTILKESN